MKNTFKVIVPILFLIFSVSAFSQTSESNLDQNFTHVVYFWLNNPDSSQDRANFENSLKKFLNQSKYAKTKFIGIPAESDREVVDDSFTYSIILSFSSKEEQDKYQKEPAHLKFIEESEDLWKKVIVYDSTGLQ
ncbi:MAG TPA: Dabb family protein [Christiangramia sp.]|nr:Dabb family protein [Christiangramia sp.]